MKFSIRNSHDASSRQPSLLFFPLIYLTLDKLVLEFVDYDFCGVQFCVAVCVQFCFNVFFWLITQKFVSAAI